MPSLPHTSPAGHGSICCGDGDVAPRTTVLLVTTCPERSRLLGRALNGVAHRAEVVHTAPDGLLKLAALHPMLLVLDLAGADSCALALLERIRHPGMQGPEAILVVGDQAAEETIARAMELGATDFVVRLEELPLRTRVGLGRLSAPSRSQGDQTVQLRLFCLGFFRVERGDQVLVDETYRNRKAKLLLKYLITHYGRRVCKDELLELLWPDLEPEAGMNNLHGTIHMLRRLLGGAQGDGAQYLLYADGCVYFNPSSPHWWDVEAFRRSLARAATLDQWGDRDGALASYMEALALYRGHFLEEDSFQDWSAPMRETLREKWLGALARTAELHEERGEAEEAIDLLRKVIHEDRYREQAYRHLMRCLYQVGHRNEALQLYQRLARLLQEDLGVEPMAETTAVRDAIARGDSAWLREN